MEWEAITAISTAVTALVIAMTVVLGSRQLSQLRRASQLDGTMRIFAQFSSPEFLAARRYVFTELDEKLKEPAFVAEHENYGSIDRAKHPELVVMFFMNEIGALVKDGLIDGPSVYAYAQYTIIKSWERIKPVIEIERRGMDNPYAWADAEYLYDNARAWLIQDARHNPRPRPSTGELFHPDHMK